MTIIVVCTAGGVFLLWAAWWIYRGTPTHGKHYTTLPDSKHITIVPQETYDAMMDDDTVWAKPMPADARAFSSLMRKMTDPYRNLPTRPTRHTHRDPTTGRYTRKEL